MSIFKKKLLTVIALLCACICFTVLGFSLTAKPEHALADGSVTQDTTAVTTYKVGDDIRAFWAYNSTSGGSYASIGNTLVNTTSTANSIADDPEHSYSDYAGNYSVTTAENVFDAKHLHGFLFRDAVATVDHGNSIVTFRTKYLGGDIYLRGMNKYTAYARTTIGGGYYFTLSADGVSLTKDSCAGGISSETILAKTAYANSTTLSYNDNLIVTYGEDALSYTEGDGANYSRKYVCDYYLKVVKVNADYTTTTLVDYGVDNGNKIVSDKQVAIYDKTFEAIGKNVSSHVNVPVFIGGYGRPINTLAPSASSVSVVGAVGDTVDTITLPNGYAFNDKTATVSSGTNPYNGTAPCYYEKTGAVTINVTGWTNKDTATTSSAKVGDEVSAFWGFNSSGGAIAGANFNKTFNSSWLSDKSISEVSAAGEGTSYSEYSGNYSITTSTSVGTLHEHGFLFQDSTDHNNSIVSFRTKYLGGDILLRGMTLKTLHYRTSVGGGYYFALSNDGYSLTADATNTGIAKNTILSKIFYDNSATLQNGDNLIVTYGNDRLLYENGDNAKYSQKTINDYYLQVLKVNADGTTTVLVDRGIDNDNKIMSSIPVSTLYHASTSSIGKNVSSNVQVPFFLGGVNRPIAMENADLSITTDIVGLEDELVTTKSSELPSGYSFRTPTDKFVYGKVSYTGSADYYNVKRNITINIASVTPTRRSITFVGGDTERVSLTGNYEFIAPEAIDGKVFIGWLDSAGNIYGAGDTILGANIPETGLTVERVDIGFSLEVGAAVRYAVDEDNKGGIRFIVDINAADLETYGTYINGFKSAIVPTDMLSGDISSHIKALDINAGLIKEKDGVKRVSFAITDILYSNFNREFSGLAYISVTTVGGEKLIATNYNEEDNSRSIYEVALKLLDDHYIELNDGDEIEGTRTAKELEVLGNYVKQTVDIVVEEDVDNHTLSISKDNGQNNGYQNIDYVEYAPYTIADEVVYNNDDSYTVTLTVTFSGDVDKDFIKKSGDDWQIPVTVRVYDQTKNKTVVYRLCGEGAVTLAQEINYNETDGVATIEFIFKPVR